MIDQKKTDEILEQVWMFRERGQNSVQQLISCKEENISDAHLRQMQEKGLLEIKDQALGLTRKGEERARMIIRGHRLTERLFTDVLELGSALIEPIACKFEHIISSEIGDAICTLLGHPKECPHGCPIPPGKCCELAHKQVSRIIFPLSELTFGSKAKVAYVVSKHHHRLDKLSSMGVVPGVEIVLHQRLPVPIIQVGHTQIAIEEDILKDIFVRRS
ncbi:MAG: metal-dependent transcriptional regulator [Candidatus Omnitrophica bacterium]|nr:metal-dependent transcriptional regulator [Candidatus Omnitrophota bacterium]